jgi:hypothetical protein
MAAPVEEDLPRHLGPIKAIQARPNLTHALPAVSNPGRNQPIASSA